MKNIVNKNITYICVSLLLLFLNPIIAIPINLLLIYFAPTKIKKVISFFLALNLGTIAFYTIPLPSDDLYRHYESMNIIRHLNFTQIFEAGYDFVYLNTFVMYLFSITGLNGLYPMFYVTIGYFLLFYIVLDFSYNNENSISDCLYIIIFIFSIFVFRDFIRMLRNQFAFIICAYSLYISYYKNNKKIAIILILSSLFIHTSVLIVIISLVLFELIYRYFKKINVNVLFFLIIPSFIFLSLLFEKLDINNYFILKIISYFTSFGHVNLNFLLFQLFIFVLIGVSLYYSKKISGDNKYINFSISFWLLTLGSVFNMTLFGRLNYFIYALSIIPMMSILKSFKLKAVIKICIIFILILSIILMYRSCLAYPWIFDDSFLNISLLF